MTVTVKYKDGQKEQQEYVDVEYHKVGYGDAYLKVNQTEDVRYDYIMKKHPMVCAEAEHIGCKIQERQCKERYAAEIGQPVGLYTEDTQESIQGAGQSKQDGDELQQNDHRLVQHLTS
jgi:hypothetical protein